MANKAPGRVNDQVPRPTPPGRPDPEQLLRDLQSEVEENGTGRLKIFLGYSSGVGKSFRMLDEGRRRKLRGQDVIVGALQPKVSAEAEALLPGLEVIPLLNVEGMPAMNVPAILLRAPHVCLVDGLAWSNPPGSPNRERWQDVEQLLRANINVIGTLNIQYVEERRQQVQSITGKQVDYTVPLSFLSQADEIVVVDSPPESGQRSQLREIALVLAADIIDRQLELYLRRNGIQQSFGTQERVLICLTPRTNPAKMLLNGRRIVERFHGELLAVTVRQSGLSQEDEALLQKNFAAAREAGAEVTVLDGEDAIETILEFALARGVTQIFIGHGKPRGAFAKLFPTPVDKLLACPRGIDIRVFPH